MKNQRPFIILVYLFLPLFGMIDSYAQTPFRSPLDIPLKLAATFGEIRPNHFHAGLDVETEQKEGLKVYSVADGYVSRIKVSATGYGNALYITHANGYTTVYGHLKRYSDKIQAYVKQKHYEKESFEIDLQLSAEIFPVKKGDVVAYSGNTGGSEGPHLHFEVRDSKTEEPINPLQFGFEISDSHAPVFNAIKIYSLNHSGVIEKAKVDVRLGIVKKDNFHYELLNNETINGCGSIGVSVNGYDLENGNEEHFTIYSLELTVDGKSLFTVEKNRFNFADTKFVNAHVDYEQRLKTNENFLKCFKMPNDKLPMYKGTTDGQIRIEDTLLHYVKIIAKDAAGNASELNFKIKGSIPSMSNIGLDKTEHCTKTIPYQGIGNYENSEVKISLPAGILYDTLCFQYSSSKSIWKTYAAIHHVHNRFTPIHSSFNLAIKCTSLPSNLQSKALLVSLDNQGNPTAVTSSFKDGWVSGNPSRFGDYSVMVDTVPPVISAINIINNKSMTKSADIKIKITDNLSGIKSYRATINGHWVLFVNDSKTQVYTYTFDEHTLAGKNNLELTVIDNKENKSVYKASFTR